MAGQVVEEVHHIASKLRIAGQQIQVRVEPRRFDVIVAGSDVDIAPQAAALFTDHQRRLGMSLQSAHAEGDVRANPLQLRRPVEIALLVESRLYLHYARDLFSMFRRANERFHERRVIPDAVRGHLERHSVGIIGGRGDEMLHRRIKALVWSMD